MLWISVDEWPLHGGGLVESTNVMDGPLMVVGEGGLYMEVLRCNNGWFSNCRLGYVTFV